MVEECAVRWCGPRGYVENVADAIALAVTDERAAGRVYNVADYGVVPEAGWVRRIAREAGWDGAIVSVPKERLPKPKWDLDFDQSWIVDSTRIRQELGYVERVPQPEALRRTIAWERENPPEQIDAAEFDYAAEDAVLAKGPQ